MLKMLKLIYYLSYAFLVISQLIVKNVDVIPLTLKMLDGANSF